MATEISGHHSVLRSRRFQINRPIFDVVAAPGVTVVEKCRKNLSLGRRATLIVPDVAVLAAQNYAQLLCEDRVFVVSLETFIAANLEELSVFRQAELTSGFRRLLELYNSRVDEIEFDKSLMIDIPPNL